jgi:hypothetical protein
LFAGRGNLPEKVSLSDPRVKPLVVVAGILALATSAVLVAGGIVSAAFLAGVLRRSVSDGFRALFLQLGALAGMGGGAIATIGVTWISKARWNSPLRLIIGVSLGLVVGLLCAWVFNQIWGRIAQRLAKWFERRN